ncbi:MAG: trypsin-like peptidase domain-containing protein [Chloroflexota bacterium]
MVNLSHEDQLKLIQILQHLPELADEPSRRLMLNLAGLNELAPRIRLDGPQFVAVSQIISYLANYGRLSYEHEALGLFLNSIKGYAGVEQQEFLDELLIKYEMMTPVVPTPAVDEWRGQDTPQTVLEKIIGENTLRPIAFLAQGMLVSRSVSYIGINSGRGSWSGTGFLITPDLLITNHHVIPQMELVEHAIFRFNYEENFRGEAQTVHEYRAKLDGLFHASEELDYAIVEIEGEPGNEWAWLPLQSSNIGKGDRVNIIQHPSGRPKHISLQNNFVEVVGGNVVQYITSTMPGSSGSPVFNDHWEVVAIHRAGGYLREPNSRQRYFRNEGIVTGKILKDLPENIRERLNQE